MSSIRLVRGKWILHDASHADGVLADAALAIVRDRIHAIGPWDEMATQFPGAEVIGSADHAVLPGFVNAHHHGYGLSHAQFGVPDAPLEAWLVDNGRMPAQDPYLATLHSAAALLRSGVTSVVDVDGARGSRSALRKRWRAKLDAYQRSGLRATLAVGMRTKAFLVHGDGEDARFLATLDGNARATAKRLVSKKGHADPDDYVRIVEDLAAEVRGDDHVAIAYGPPGPHWVDDTTLRKIVRSAQRHDLAIHTHANESIYEALASMRFRGEPLMQALERMEMLDVRLTLAHAVWLTHNEVDRIGKAGASVVHNPSSNLRLRAGRAPVLELREAGVRVGLGMDGTTLADDDDMFKEMRLAWRLNETPLANGPALGPREVLAMATTVGASIAPHGSVTGALRPGSPADLTLIDTRRLTAPWVSPEIDPTDLIVRRARADDVAEVLVGGKIVLRAGEPVLFDASSIADALVEQITQAKRTAVVDPGLPALRLAVTRWYAGWPMDAAREFIQSGADLPIGSVAA